MRLPSPIRTLCCLMALFATVAAAFNVSVRTMRGPEGDVFNSAYVEANGERFALVVPHGWQSRAGTKENSITLNSLSGESPITIEFSAQDPKPILASAEAMRQAVVPFLQEARVLEEFAANSGYGPGRGMDLSFVLLGHRQRSRVIVVPLAHGYVSFNVACSAENQESVLQILGATLTSFHSAPLSAQENAVAPATTASPSDKKTRPKARIAAATQNFEVLHTEPPPPVQTGPKEPKPIFAGYEDHVRLGVVCLLMAVLVSYTLARDRREAEIRALCGGYLSDGTEVARFKMPEWFTPPEPKLSAASKLAGPDWSPAGSQHAPAKDPVREFLEQAPALLANIRNALRDLGRSGNESEWHTILGQLPQHFSTIKEKANFWEMRPVWQLSSAVELLARRVAEKPKDATPSTLRTITAATDLLQSLCVEGVRPNLIIDPPLKVLAVDDDPLCLRAVVFALQKAGVASDVAADGAQALAQASAKPYDVIFMDIQMPEMDGLTACKKIHETAINAETPVVFVTIQSDFHTRAQSSITGGSDLMAKPFLVFELTVKALMASMRKRLQKQQSAGSSQPAMSPAPVAIRAAITSSLGQTQPPAVTVSRPAAARPRVQDMDSASDPNQKFPERSAEYVLALQNILDDVVRATAKGEAKEELGVLYVQVHAFVAQAEKAGFQLASLIGSNLERLVKKLYEKPKHANPSTLNTVSSAMSLLREVCRAGVEQKSADHSRVRMLVVDDEPLARRAITGALQLAFDQPESVEDGMAALALAREHSYDVIFTDVRMPGMDGFELCTSIRDTERNRHTPVIFITGLGDDAAREQAVRSGGSDFIAKPCLPAEITLKALTFIIRKRLDLPGPPGALSNAGLGETAATATAKPVESDLLAA